MSLPRTNLTSTENQPWVNSVSAAASFVTAAPVLMDGSAAIEIVYSGVDGVDGWLRLQGSNSGDQTKAKDLTLAATTMTTAASSILFNVSQIGYGYIHLVYDAGSNTTGTITARLTRKQVS